MAKIGNRKGGNTNPAMARVSPLKPGLRGARNWASAQIRSASYDRKKFRRMVIGGVLLFGFLIWMGLWLGGFLPHIKSGYQDFVKQRLMAMGFVVKTVDVVGEGRVQEARVKAMLGVRPGDYLYDMNIEQARARIEQLGWVDSAVVRRLWPDRIVVYINEKRPYALWQNGREFKIVDAKGNIIQTARAEEFASLPFIVGKNAGQNAKTMQDILAQHQNIARRVQTMIYIGSRRWDIILDNGTHIMLPQQNPDKALGRLAGLEKSGNNIGNILQTGGFRIDMRINGRIGIMPVKTKPKMDKNKA